jgi:hypothetical protein
VVEVDADEVRTSKRPAYGGEAAAARLRYAHMRHVHHDDVSCAVAGDSGHRPYLSTALAGMDTTPDGSCSHPATYISRICVSCSTVMEVEG